MGNICNSTTDDQSSKQSINVILKIKINNVPIEIINITKLKSECVVLISEARQLETSEVLQASVKNKIEVLSQIFRSKKTVQIADPSKEVEFKKVIVCSLPTYNIKSFQQYRQTFSCILNEVFKHGKQFIFVFSQTSEQNTMPNQLIISDLLKYLQKMQFSKIIPTVKLVSQDANICALFRLQIMKGSVETKALYKFQRLKINQLEPSILY